MTKIFDSYLNTVSGLGTNDDKNSYNTFRSSTQLDWKTAEDIYGGDGTAARIIDLPVDDSVDRGFTIEGDDFDWQAVIDKSRKMKTLEKLGDTWRWARLYRGALCVPIIDSQSKMEKPLDRKSIRSITGWNVIPAPWAFPESYNPGIGAVNFAQPQYYRIDVPHGADHKQAEEGQMGRKIHWSRVIRIDGTRVPPHALVNSDGWGPSVLDKIQTELFALGASMGYASNMLHEMSILVLRLENWRQQLAGGAKSKAEAAEALATLKHGIDNLHVLALDKEDELVETVRSTSGIEALINKFEDALIRATGFPRSTLLRQSPTGLGANGQQEREEWAHIAHSQRDTFLRPALEQAIEFILWSMQTDPDTLKYEIKFNPIHVPSPREKAETSKIQSEADAKYVDLGVTNAEEIRIRKIAAGDIPEEHGTELPEQTVPKAQAEAEAEATAKAKSLEEPSTEEDPDEDKNADD